LSYPGFFEGGLVGVRIDEPIENREAFLYVPISVTISVVKCLEDPLLKPFYAKYPDIFT